MEMSSTLHFSTLYLVSDTILNGLTYTPIEFYEQASHIRGQHTIFIAPVRSSNGLLAILKNTWSYNNSPIEI
jgi:hypothetical protein